MIKKPRKIDPDDPIAQEMLRMLFTSQDPFWRGLSERLIKAETECKNETAKLAEKWDWD